MIKKTESFAVNEAYTLGYNQAVKDLSEAKEKIEKWMDSPEWSMLQALNIYVNRIVNGLTKP